MNGIHLLVGEKGLWHILVAECHQIAIATLGLASVNSPQHDLGRIPAPAPQGVGQLAAKGW